MSSLQVDSDIPNACNEQSQLVRHQNKENSQSISEDTSWVLHCFFLTILTLFVVLVAVLWQNSESVSSASAGRQPYIPVDEELEAELAAMRQRPLEKVTQNLISSEGKPSEQAYFAYRLFKEPHNQLFLKAEYYHYERTYQISAYQQQRLCIVSVGRELAHEGRHRWFFDSIQSQNYTNYRLVFIDDASSNESVASVKKYLNTPRFEQLKQHLTFIANEQRMYELWNRDNAIRNYCQDDDIIIELNPDDVLLGRQAFKFINSVYQNESVWVFYSNYVFWQSQIGEPCEGISGRPGNKLLDTNTDRVADQQLISATRTFRKKLYLKIDQTDYIDQNDAFYKWCADLFMHYSLIELAGSKHYLYLHEILYYYSHTRSAYKSAEKAREKYRSYMITPYLPLATLDDQPQRKYQHPVPAWIKIKLKSIEHELYAKRTQLALNRYGPSQIDQKYFEKQVPPGPS